MILSCERCEARYAIDDDRLGSPGRKVRCTNCGHVWFQASTEANGGAAAEAVEPATSPDFEQDQVLAPVTEEIQVSAMRRFGATTRKPEPQRKIPEWRKPARRLAMLAVPSLAAMLCLFAFKDTLTALWPPAARLYAAVGMPASATAPGLAIRSVRMDEQVADGHRTVIVEGEVANTGAEPRHVPSLRATLAQGTEPKARWSFSVQPAELAPGQATPFRTQYADAPEGARSVSVGLWR